MNTSLKVLRHRDIKGKLNILRVLADDDTNMYTATKKRHTIKESIYWCRVSLWPTSSLTPSLGSYVNNNPILTLLVYFLWTWTCTPTKFPMTACFCKYTIAQYVLARKNIFINSRKCNKLFNVDSLFSLTITYANKAGISDFETVFFFFLIQSKKHYIDKIELWFD